MGGVIVIFDVSKAFNPYRILTWTKKFVAKPGNVGRYIPRSGPPLIDRCQSKMPRLKA